MKASGEVVHPVILAGGGGRRLWPLSRMLAPKQFSALTGPRSLLQETAARVSGNGFAAPLVMCNAEHRFRTREQLREIGRPPMDIVLEPTGRNTAPAACAAVLLLAARDIDALLLLLPSDHVISEPDTFLEAVSQGADAARAGWLVTFAVPPREPATDYGYIKRGAVLANLPGCEHVERFVEKPDRASAERYLAEGGYAWNSGIFLASARTLLKEFARLQPAVVEACRQAIAHGRHDLDFLRLEADAFERCPSVSIDHAILERTDLAVAVSAEMGWRDVGSWRGLWEALAKDPAGNALLGDSIAEESCDSLLYSEDRLLAAHGIENLVVAATRDAVLVCPMDRAEKTGKLAERLEHAGREETSAHPTVYRPWGSYSSVSRGDRFHVKRIVVAPGESLSLQRHRHRAEHWIVVAGEAEVTRNGACLRLRPDQSIYIPPGMVHRLANPADAPLHVIEVQTGEYLGEDDIERFEDAYERE